MNATNPKAFVFVLMPFSEDFGDIYEAGIKQACKDAGAYCERVDEQIFVEDILGRVYNQIAKADVIVAEMTGRNSNVFYETGYAHALNKRVILLTRSAEDIPFDLKHYPHIVHGGKIAKLKSELEARIRWCIENPKESLSSVDLGLQAFINGIALLSNPVIDISVKSEKRIHDYLYTEAQARLTLGIHNPTSRVLTPESFALALVAQSQLVFLHKSLIRSITQLPDGRSMFNIDLRHALFPGGWFTEHVRMRLTNKVEGDLLTDNAIRIFTELGPKDYPFIIRIRIAS
ncbi:MAG TPA: hypothetical protein VF571_00530 [Pyrinomonadaceae bacterium]|jgi:hypothetical protein